MHPKRFIDKPENYKLIESSMDFKRRRHGPPLVRVASAFAAVLIATFILLSYLVQELLFLPAEQPPPEGLILAIFLITIFSATAVGVFAVFLIHRVRRIVMATEFQNLVFASSMRIGAAFCLIVHKERTGVYCDYDFNEMFAPFGYHAGDPFRQLLASEGFKREDEERLLKVLEEGHASAFDFSLKRPDGLPHKMTVKVEPIERPAGFFIIRGYDHDTEAVLRVVS